MQNNLFDLVKSNNIDIKEFLTSAFGFEWHQNKTKCPFHNDSKPSLSYSKQYNSVKCFTCDQGGDLINFIVDYKNVSKIDACKIILDHEGISEFDINTIPNYKIELLKENNKKKIAQKEKELILSKENTIIKMTKKAHLFKEEFENYKLELFEKFKDIFPNQSDTFMRWYRLYLGYDNVNKTLVILNRTADYKCYNIKYREKYKYDYELKKYSSQRLNGKWLSTHNSTPYPFPYSYFVSMKKESNIVFIVEGEKDAINLLSYDLNVLTLGGVTSSWDKYKDLLIDMEVYIWFDNDAAGYENMIKKYHEINSITKQTYLVLFNHINNAYPNKYDISDFLNDKRFKTKEEIFHAISYSKYRLNDELIKEIEESIGKDLSKYYITEKFHTFETLEKELLIKDVNSNYKYVVSATGKLDKDIERIKSVKKEFNALKRNGILMKICDYFSNSTDLSNNVKEILFKDGIKTITNLLDIKPSLSNNYTQVCIREMVKAFNKMIHNAGCDVASIRGLLAIWNGRYYEIVDSFQFKGFLYKWLSISVPDIKKHTKKTCDEVYDNILVSSLNLDPLKLKESKRVITLLNGTLIITNKGKVIYKNVYSKADGSTNILNFEYDKNANCPKFVKFLNRNLPDKDDQRTLLEYIGYCLLPNHNYECFLLLYGKSGANGKSVIMDLISSFFGSDNISSLNLHQFQGHLLTALDSKYLNIGSELDSKKLDNGQISVLKQLVSPRDKLTIDPKNRPTYQLEPEQKPKLIFSTNEKPKHGLDDAFFRRMLLLNFDTTIYDHEKVRNLSERFHDEMPGILNLVLISLDNLVKVGSFTKSKRMIDDLESYKDIVDPMRKYLQENIEINKDSMIPKVFLYAHYKDYVKSKGLHPLNEGNFWNRIKEEVKFDGSSKSAITIKHEKLPYRNRVFSGIYCIPDEMESFEYKDQLVDTKSINFDIKTKFNFVTIKE